MPKLLVVDDEPAILHAFRRAFREPELTLLTSSSAMEGIDLVRTESPDVVILDVHLPDLPGLDALRRIRELDAKVPVIFITGHGHSLSAPANFGRIGCDAGWGRHLGPLHRRQAGLRRQGLVRGVVDGNRPIPPRTRPGPYRRKPVSGRGNPGDQTLREKLQSLKLRSP